jgi:hypothetical protein
VTCGPYRSLGGAEIVAARTHLGRGIPVSDSFEGGGLHSGLFIKSSQGLLTRSELEAVAQVRPADIADSREFWSYWGTPLLNAEAEPADAQKTLLSPPPECTSDS